MDRIVSAVQLIVTASMNGDRCLARRSGRLMDVSGRAEASRHFDAEVRLYRISAASRMVIEKDVVPVRA
jgi:hypothetical protein